MTTIEELQAAGLKVDCSSSIRNQSIRYTIHLPVSLLSNVPDQSPVRVSHPEITLADIPCSVYKQEDTWITEVWERVPGPDESDFLVTSPTLQEALLVAHNFYLGQPTVRADWSIPLHRHPELLQVPLEEVIAQAVTIAMGDFVRIRERRIEQMYGSFAPMILTQGKTRWEKALQMQFIQVQHHTYNDMFLYLRRDAQEAYIRYYPDLW